MFNIVEAIEDSKSNQRCVFGYLVEDHAVYCHNDGWEDSPRKCRRSWCTGGKVKDEECPGFIANPSFGGILEMPDQVEYPCSECKGAKLVLLDSGKRQTCHRCGGDGKQPGEGQHAPKTT